MTSPELTQQLTQYADAITAFSMVQAIAFCYSVALGEGFAKAVTRGKGARVTTIGIIIGTGAYYFLVTRCVSLAEELDKRNSTIASVLSTIQATRLTLIVVGGLLSIFALWAIKLGSGHR
jgi:hypothetical protein